MQYGILTKIVDFEIVAILDITNYNTQYCDSLFDLCYAMPTTSILHHNNYKIQSI